jgi:cyclase
VSDPSLLSRLSSRFGAQCTVLAIDAARTAADDGWEVVVRGGRERTGLCAVEWARRGTGLGAGEILLTSWDRDGTRSGYDTKLIAAVSAAVDVPVIASGGAAGIDHLVEAVAAGASAVLAASLFHEDGLSSTRIKATLATRGLEVRP